MADNSSAKASLVQKHTRTNETPVAKVEKKVLLWLAARMPPWVVPDTLTVIGLFGSVLIFASYTLTFFHPGFLWLASFGFMINWFGDSLDGTLARYRKIERPRYGFFIDHIIDSISEVIVFIGLGFSPYLRFDLALLALISYLLASIYVYLNNYVNGVFRISYGGLGPTEIRMIAILTNTAVFFSGNPHIQLPLFNWLSEPLSMTLYDLVVSVVVLIIILLFLYNTIYTAMSLSREDREAYRAKKKQQRAEKTVRHQTRRDKRLVH